MKLLVLGGTVFLGRAVVEEALARGDEVTLFNRGLTAPDLFPDAEHVRGDRERDVSALRGRRWDAVLDTSGYVPRVVRASAAALHDAVEQYVFVSSISVYASFAEPVDEDSPLAVLAEPGSEDVERHYGALKALCEAEVTAAFDGRATNVRPGIIVGRHDPTGRFTHWVHRVARGGETLVPAPIGQPLQIVDVRDLAAWLLALADQGVTGVFNATGPATMREVLETSRRVAGSNATFTEVDPGFLVERGHTGWRDLPLWLGGAGPEHAHMFTVDTARAVAAGLTFRPLAETVEDTLANAEPVDGIGLDAGRERELLAEWHGR